MQFNQNRRGRFNRTPPPNQPGPNPPRPSNWLEDDEWGDLAQRVKRQAAEDLARNKFHHKPTNTGKMLDPEKVELNLKLSLPKFRFDSVRKPVLKLVTTLKKYKFVAQKITDRPMLAAVVVVVLGVGSYFGYTTLHKKTPVAVQGATTSVPATTDDIVPSKDIKFDVVLPQGRKIDKDKIAYDAKRNFAKYDDEINAVKVSVTQQPLPIAFKDKPDESVSRMAADFAATEKLTVDKQNMYYGVSEKGPQTLILTKKDVLIFITTQQKVEKDALKLYAYNLD